ncbi:hypothetical protein Aab01nite_25980 [Paractinoplanes abujensis]|uniref:Secreted protein n=1 Tax=Paractinoplanes abujensis TaxID=882441 RepID=A0A7W7CXL1_9ACTN|nr:hypothetical protein [Actinoplanes abujensis]MBB4696526.1 hypothetical protein [Actinoplanes abujensis]GID19008.1 hypothetical protein Aab01nite_25980 [Actinoplanes abujensis]
MKDGLLIAGGVAGAVGVAGLIAAGLSLSRRGGSYLAAGHALARPDDVDPLPRVLRRGLGGLTVPVTPGPRGELFLGPGAPQPGRTLRRLVLTPLLARARGQGGRPGRPPFRLVVEFTGAVRDADTLLRAYRILDQQLRDHAGLLSRCTEDDVTPGAVTVSVSGIVDVRGLLAAQAERYLFAEGSFDDIGSRSAPAGLVPMISEPWSRRFGWDGLEPIPAEERHLLHALVRSAHDDGRTVCVSGLPEGPRRARAAVWTELSAAGVDVIADHDQRGLARHLRRHPALGPMAQAQTARSARRPSPRPNGPRPDRRREPV